MVIIDKLKSLFIEKRAKEEMKLDNDLIILTILASLLAAFGLNMGKNHLIFASMMISPLFNPIIAIVIFLVEKDIKNFLKSIFTLVVITLLSISISIVFFYALKLTGYLNDFSYVAPQINLFNLLGISFLIGLVGSLLWLWPKTPNISAGLAVAISLVPPIVNFSAGVVLGEYSKALSYLTVFALNLLGILISSTIIFIFWPKNKL